MLDSFIIITLRTYVRSFVRFVYSCIFPFLLNAFTTNRNGRIGCRGGGEGEGEGPKHDLVVGDQLRDYKTPNETK